MKLPGATRISDLGLSSEIQTLFQQKQIDTLDILACVTLGQLKEWGLSPLQISSVINMLK